MLAKSHNLPEPLQWGMRGRRGGLASDPREAGEERLDGSSRGRQAWHGGRGRGRSASAGSGAFVGEKDREVHRS